VDDLKRRGTPLGRAERNTALARERAALNAHCDLLHQMSLEALGDSLDALAGRRLDNFLHWGENVGEHALGSACPSE
jgi:hypothetical protein